MKNEWIQWNRREKNPWEFAAARIAEKRLGRIVEIGLQEVVDLRTASGPADNALNRLLSEWRKRLTALLGPITAQNVLRTKTSLAAIWRHGEGPIIRLFADTAAMGSTGGLSFEVIGTKESLIFRLPSALASIQVSLGGGRFDSCLVQRVDDARHLSNLPVPGRPVRIGILTFEHPHAVRVHVPALRHLRHMVRVSAIADEDRRRCLPWLKLFGARHYPTCDQLLADPSIDAVLVTSGNWRHAAHAIAAARAGKDILCDKPIATTRADAVAMARVCREQGVRFVTTYPCRFHPAVEQLKRRIAAGELGMIEAVMATNHGRMYLPSPPAWVLDPRRNGGGCIIDHTVHVADLIRHLTRREFTSVRTLAASALQGIQAEDIAVSQGRLSGGAVFQIDCSWSRKATDPCWGDVTLRVVGTQGAASIDLYNNHQVQAYTAHGVECHYPNYLIHQHGMIFVDYARAKRLGLRGVNADVVDGLRTMELVFACYDAVRRNRTVPVQKGAGGCTAR